MKVKRQPPCELRGNGWTLTEIAGIPQLIWIYKGSDIVFGARINVPDLLKSWTENIDDPEFSYELVDSDRLTSYLEDNGGSFFREQPCFHWLRCRCCLYF